MSGISILVIDDDPVATHLAARTLEPRGYTVFTVASVAEADTVLETERPDAIVLDLLLPDGHGRDVCQSIRSRSLIPIIVVTVVGHHQDRLACLRAGADDVLTKPYDPEELVLRLAAVLQRARGSAPASPSPYRFRGLVVDAASHSATLHGDALTLTPSEERLLERLASRPGVVHLTDDLLRHVWGPHAAGQHATLYLHVSRLRQKLRERSRQPIYLQTRARIGYFLPAPEAAPQAGDD